MTNMRYGITPGICWLLIIKSITISCISSPKLISFQSFVHNDILVFLICFPVLPTATLTWMHLIMLWLVMIVFMSSSTVVIQYDNLQLSGLLLLNKKRRRRCQFKEKQRGGWRGEAAQCCQWGDGQGGDVQGGLQLQLDQEHKECHCWNTLLVRIRHWRSGVFPVWHLWFVHPIGQWGSDQAMWFFKFWQLLVLFKGACHVTTAGQLCQVHCIWVLSEQLK